jgi:hypothetical protein
VTRSDFDVWQSFSVMWYLHGINKEGMHFPRALKSKLIKVKRWRIG